MIRRPPRSTLFPSTPLFRSRSHAVHRAPPAGADDAGGLLELHYRRSCDLRALAHPLAVEDRHLLPLAVEVGLPAPALHLTLGGTLLERGFVHGHGGDEAHVHELYGLVLHPVTVSPLVRSVEALLQLAYLERLLGLDRELEGLSPVAQDRKSTRLNSSHANISYAVFCLKKKKQKSLRQSRPDAADPSGCQQ